MTSLIVDASVAVKWFVEEADTASARRLGDDQNELWAPDLVIAEVGNALWKKCTRAALSSKQLVAGMNRLPNLFDRLFPMSALGPRAAEMAALLKHPVYDCFYLALAERERLPIITADAKLIAAANRLHGIEARRL
jgi:predicted nucleic acid-binding protein